MTALREARGSVCLSSTREDYPLCLPRLTMPRAITARSVYRGQRPYGLRLMVRRSTSPGWSSPYEGGGAPAQWMGMTNGTRRSRMTHRSWPPASMPQSSQLTDSPALCGGVRSAAHVMIRMGERVRVDGVARLTCGAAEARKHGHDRRARRRFRRCVCRRRFTALTAMPFFGYRFPPQRRALAVRRYVRYRLGSGEVTEPLAERGVRVESLGRLRSGAWGRPRA